MPQNSTRYSEPSVVTFVMRTRSRDSSFRRALASIRSQTVKTWSLVVVNDGGSVETCLDAIQAELSGYEDRIRVIHNSSSEGRAKALNKGLNLVKSEFFVIHDDDDVLAPTFISKSLEIFNADTFEQLAAVVHNFRIIEEEISGEDFCQIREIPKSEFLPHHEFATYTKLVSLRMLLRFGMHFPPIAMIGRTRFLDLGSNLGRFDRHEDTQIVWSLLEAGEIFQSDDVQAHWMIRPLPLGSAYRNSIHDTRILHSATISTDNDRLRRAYHPGVVPHSVTEWLPALQTVSSPRAGATRQASRLKMELVRLRNRSKQVIFGRPLKVIVQKFGNFDAEWYYLRYEDCRALGTDARTHYLTLGWLDGRSPAFGVSSQALRRRHPILTKLGMNSLEILSLKAFLRSTKLGFPLKKS